jgi:hypothetical protein
VSNYTGIYEAIVHNLDDPNREGRARLLVPAVLGQAMSAWARPVLGVRGTEGTKVGDRAWVLFEHGSLSRPTWLAALPDLADASHSHAIGDLPVASPGEVSTTELVRADDPRLGTMTGDIKRWPTTTPPAGWLLCNGGTFSSTTYPALAAVLGDTYGTHAGTTYYLPKFYAPLPDTDWANITLINGWVNYGGNYQVAQMRRVNGWAEFRGLIIGSSRTNDAFFVAPVGYRHSGGDQLWMTPSDSASLVSRIDTAGTSRPTPGNMTWIAGGAGFIALSHITYSVDDIASNNSYIIKT